VPIIASSNHLNAVSLGAIAVCTMVVVFASFFKNVIGLSSYITLIIYLLVFVFFYKLSVKLTSPDI